VWFHTRDTQGGTKPAHAKKATLIQCRPRP
jgi:hypothetical protein